MNVKYNDKVIDVPVEVIYKQIGCPLILGTSPEDYIQLLSDKMLWRTYAAARDLLTYHMWSPYSWSHKPPIHHLTVHPMTLWMADSFDNYSWIAQLFLMAVKEAKYREFPIPTEDDALASFVSDFSNLQISYTGFNGKSTAPPMVVCPEYRYSGFTKEWQRCISAYKCFYLWEFCDYHERWTKRFTPLWVREFREMVKDVTA